MTKSCILRQFVAGLCGHDKFYLKGERYSEAEIKNKYTIFTNTYDALTVAGA